MTTAAQIQPFFDAHTSTISYVVYDQPAGHAAIIDPVLDYQPNSGRTSTESVDEIIRFIAEQRLQLDWILETHVHADHVTAAHLLRQRLGGKIGIGDHIRQVQHTFKQLFHLGDEFSADGSQFDHLFADNETFRIGALTATVLYVPGHTPADLAYRIGNAIFVGDTLFMPDVGTARCDFPGGDPHALYQSIKRLLAFAPDTELYMCHDYPGSGRAMQHVTTVAAQRQTNIHVNDRINETEFIRLRTARDATLSPPNLILPSIQINMRAGQLPPPESNQVSYLKIPLNVL